MKVWAGKRKGKKRSWTGPVILPSALKAFLRRPVDSFSWIKDCTKKQLLEEIPEPFTFHTDPRKHQLACFYIGINSPEFLFLLDTGAGKSKLVLDILYYRKLHYGEGPWLVLVPAAANTEGWVNEIEIHRPELKSVKLLGSREDRQRLLERDADIYLLNYDGLQSYMTHLVKEKKKNQKARQIDYKDANSFSKLFTGVVMDESHQVGNRASLRFRMANAVAKECSLRYALTGTPFGRNPEKLWSQFYIVDHGQTLGETLGLYRAVFFDAKDNFWGGIDYTFDPSKEKELHRIIQHRSIRYKDTEFADVPNIVRQRHRLSFGMDAEQYYTKVLAELRQARGDLVEQRNSFLRMRQVCAGFLALKGEDEQRVEVAFYTNPKVEELETLVDGLPEEEKLIVYHEFIRSGDMVTEMLDRKKVRWARVGGGKTKRNPVEQMRKFLNDPKCRILIFNYKSGGGAGLNFHTVCRHLVYYESPVDPIVRYQTERRITGGLRTTKRRVYMHDLVLAKSVDEAVLKFIEQGKDLFQAIVEGHAL